MHFVPFSRLFLAASLASLTFTGCGSGESIDGSTDQEATNAGIDLGLSMNPQLLDSLTTACKENPASCAAAGDYKPGVSSTSEGPSSSSADGGTSSSSTSDSLTSSSSSEEGASSTDSNSSSSNASSSTGTSASSSSVTPSSSSAKPSSSSAKPSSSSVTPSSSSSSAPSSSSATSSSSVDLSGATVMQKNATQILPAGLGPFTISVPAGMWNNGTYDMSVFTSGTGNNSYISYTIAFDGGTATAKSGTYTPPNGIIVAVPKTVQSITLTIVSAKCGDGSSCGTSGTEITNPTVSFKTNGN